MSGAVPFMLDQTVARGEGVSFEALENQAEELYIPNVLQEVRAPQIFSVCVGVGVAL